MRSHLVVVAHDVKEDRLHLEGCRGGVLGQELLQGAVPALDLSAGLWMVGRRVLVEHATLEQVTLEARAPAARARVADGPVVAQHARRRSKHRTRVGKDVAHVEARDGHEDVAGHHPPRVVVEERQDLDLGAVA